MVVIRNVLLIRRKLPELDNTKNFPPEGSNRPGWARQTLQLLPCSLRSQNLPQNDSVVVGRIFRRIKQRDRLAFLLERSQHWEGGALALQFLEIAASEFQPFLRIVGEPSPEGIAGGDFLQP